MDCIDMRGKPCPLPVIEAKKALRGARPGDRVRLLVDDDVARQNLQKMAEGLAHAFSYETTLDGDISIDIEVREAAATIRDDAGGLVVAVGRAVMGGGNDELGGMLLKSFIYSLTELEAPPELLLFFNDGVRLTTEGSAVLKDLLALAERGTRIESCGACLNFNKLTDKLRVGEITNMHAIVGAMAAARRLVTL